MDNEKKYKELEGKIKKAYLYAQTDSTKAVLEDILPELKESEDERIRKELIAYHRSMAVAMNGNRPCVHEAWIDWLEEQGDKPQGKTALEAANEEKIDNENKTVLEAINVETKFKIEKGKWYVCIKDLLDNYANKAFYKGDIYLSTRDGSLIPCNSNVPFDVKVCSDMYFREWTIQDAKDGDMLYSLDSNQPFIYKERNMHGQATAYCGINKYGKFFVWNTKDCIITLDKYIPATKSQRDTLMNAMTKAGWQFNFEKKELKLLITNGGDFEQENCEQKPAWSEEDECYMAECINAIATKDGWSFEEKRKTKHWLKSLKQRIGG